MLTIGLEGFQPADSTVKREMQMRICMNHALAKVIYIIGGRGGMVVWCGSGGGGVGGFSIKYGHEATLSVLNN